MVKIKRRKPAVAAAPPSKPAAKPFPGKKAPAAKKTVSRHRGGNSTATVAPVPAPLLEEGQTRGRGRPRKDGLLPGSEAVLELKAAKSERRPVEDWVIELMTSDVERQIWQERNDCMLASGEAPTTKKPAASKKTPVKVAAAAKTTKVIRKKVIKRRRPS